MACGIEKPNSKTQTTPKLNLGKQMDDRAAGGGAGGRTPPENKSTQELSKDGERHLEATIGSAFQILSSMNDELCNPSLWTNPNTASATPTSNGGAGGLSNGHHSSNGDVLPDPASLSHHFEMASGVLEDARFRYKSSVASLRTVLTAIANAQKAEASDMDSTGSPDNQAEIEDLEEQAAALRKELTDRNEYLKVLIDQLRNMISDISAWQSPHSL